MPRRARSTFAASYFHVINRSAGRRALFEQRADYRSFLTILSEGLGRHPVRLIAYSLMPTHWHLVMGPTDTPALSRCLHWVTVTHAVRLQHTRHLVGDGPVYQGRFTSMEIPAVGDLMRVCRYVERNALQARLVRRAQDWPWGSLAERLQPVPGLPLVTTPFLSSRAWVDYVNSVRPGDDVSRVFLPSVSPQTGFDEAPGRMA
jgi:putative transposase